MADIPTMLTTRGVRRGSRALKGLFALIAAATIFAATTVVPVVFVAAPAAGRPHAASQEEESAHGLQRRQAVGAFASATFLSMLPQAASAAEPIEKALAEILKDLSPDEVPKSKYGTGGVLGKPILPVLSVDAFQKSTPPAAETLGSIWDKATRGIETPAQKLDREQGRSPAAGLLPGLSMR